MNADGRPDGFEQARHDVDLDIEVTERMDEVEQRAVAVVRERDDDALHIVAPHNVDDLLEPAKQRDLVEVGAQILRLRIHEADEFDPELRMLLELPADKLADIAGADDDRVLDVARVSPGDPSRDGSCGRDQHEGAGPEGDRGLERPASGIKKVGDDDRDPRQGCECVEKRAEIVERRVIGSALVTTVEAEQAGGESPAREHRRADQKIGRCDV